MRFSVSNIAWNPHNNSSVLALLKKYGVQGIEVAPGKIWPGLEGASFEKAVEYKKFMDDQNFAIPAMQALLFGRPELQVFVPSSHNDFFGHIRQLAELAQGLGCGVLVFGAPKNRRRGDLSYNEAMDWAENFFRRIGDICQDFGCIMGMEHNPMEYGCDFITNVAEAGELVERVNHPAFKLHLDSGGIFMSGNDLEKTICDADGFVHYHISEPMLGAICNDTIKQRRGIEALRNINYDKWVSMEMRAPDSHDLLERSLDCVKKMLEK